METINDRIKTVVDDSGLTKTEFAKRINISQPTVSMFCYGKANPSDRTIADICREFRISETWLRTGEGPMRVEINQHDRLERFFTDVLTGAPDARSDLLAAMAKLPPEFWEMLANCAREIVSNLDTKKERQEKPLTLPKVAARGDVDPEALANVNTDIPLPDMESDVIP